MSNTEDEKYKKQGSRSPSKSDHGSPDKSERRSSSQNQSRAAKRSHSRSHSRKSRSRSHSPEHRRRRSQSTPPSSSQRRHKGSGGRDYQKAEGNNHGSNAEEKPNPSPSTCLGVFGLSLYTTERDLREVFNHYGPLASVNVVYDQRTGRSRGFAFVYFEKIEDAKAAMEKANGMELDERRIRVDFSFTKRAHTPTPGIYMGRSTRNNGSWRGNNRRGRGSYHDGGYGRGYDRDYDYDHGYDRGYDHGYDRHDRYSKYDRNDRNDRYDRNDKYDRYDRYDDYDDRYSRRRSPSPYYSRYRSRSRSYTPRRY